MKHRILAVDDEPHMLQLLQRIVSEKTPYEIETTANALQVPALLAEGTYSVVITDLKMPGMDGLDILRLAGDLRPPVAVVIITAFGSQETASTALSEGVTDYLTKPFRQEQLLLSLHRAISWQELRADNARLEAIFEIEPYARAQSAFAKEYASRLRRRCADDQEQMTHRSGLPPDQLGELLED